MTARVFGEKIKVVKALSKPTISIASSPNENEADGFEYYETTASGIGYNILNNESDANLSIKINGVDGSNTGSLSLGPHTLTYTVSKPGYTTREFVERVYVQGTLSAPTISYSGDYKGQLGTENKARYEFSYLNYAQMSFTVSAGNMGATTVNVYVNGSQKTSADWMLDPDTDPTIKVVQTRQYCKKKETEETVEVRINPVTVAVPELIPKLPKQKKR